jgi:hypothetical protein
LEDKRCCGREVCIINAQGICWCGQKWDGERMILAKPDKSKKIESVKKRISKNKELINSFYTLNLGVSNSKLSNILSSEIF